MKNSNRIWLLSNEYEPQIIGGLGTAVTHLAKAYRKSGTPVTVISQNNYSGIQHTRKHNVRIIRFPLNSTYFSKKKRQFKSRAVQRWLTKKSLPKPKGIHIHSIQFKNVAKHYQKKYRIPVIYTCHSIIQLGSGSPSKKKYQAKLNQVKLLKLANKIVVPSHSEKSKLIRLYPFCRKKTVVIYHGISKPKRKKKRYRYPRRLLFVGRLIHSKGIIPLLKAIAILKRRGYKIQLHLVGKGSRSYTKHLRRLIRRLGISSEVKLLGFRNQYQVQTMYRTYGAVVMPSRQESFGLVALEALANGVPLVSTRAGGLSEFVSSKVAQTIPKASPTAIANAIISMRSRRALTKKRVQSGLRLAARFRWSTSARKYKRLFRQLQR